MNENDDNKETKYDLYTEKIVKNPWNKVRRIIKHFAKVIGSAIVFGIVFGIVASVVVLLFYPRAKKFIGFEEESVTRTMVVIPTDSHFEEPESSEDVTAESDSEPETEVTAPSTDSESAPSEVSSIENNKELEGFVDDRISTMLGAYKPGNKELGSMFDSVRLLVFEMNKSFVSITAVNADTDAFDGIIDDEESQLGVIIAEDNERFYILTEYDGVDSEKTLYLTYNDGTMAFGNFIKGDRTIGYAVVAGNKSVFTNGVPTSVKAASLGNSYVIQQSEPVLALGKLYGYEGACTYTNAVSTRVYLDDTDSSYRAIVTNIPKTDTDRGILMNTQGEIVGLLVTGNVNTGDVVIAYGISDLKALIERLVNGIDTPYLGVHVQGVTAVMQTAYGMPKGLYVDLVEEGSPAYNYGIQSGDVICSINGVLTTTLRELQNVLFTAESTEDMEFLIKRPGKDEYREIILNISLAVED